MTKFIIRWAKPGDGLTLYNLIMALAVFERAPHAVKTTAETIDFQLAEETPPFECLLAESQAGEAIGFALFFHTYSTWEGKRGIHLEDLFVRPAARRYGVGRALLARLAQITIQRNCRRLEWSVLDWNKLALTFYDSLHAETMSQWCNQRLSGRRLERLAGMSKPV